MNWPVIKDVLSADKPVTIQVKGTSMYPKIFSGDWVTIVPAKDNYDLNSVVLVQTSQEKYLLHRVVAMTPELIIKGDNITECDRDIVDILGVVTNHRITFQSFLRRIHYRIFSTINCFFGKTTR